MFKKRIEKIKTQYEELLLNFGLLKNIPNVKDIYETIEQIKKGKSIARFGDGELLLINNQDIPFQKGSKELSSRLKEVLSSDMDNLLIAIPHFIYNNKKNLYELSKKFWTKNGKNFRDTIKKYIDLNKTYYAAEFTLGAISYKKFDTEKYFSNLRSIWENKKITIIAGETLFDKIKYNIFDNAKSISYINAPSKNAFEKYDEILESAKKIKKDELILIILGPCAKILAHDLAKLNYQALNVGHILKQYDWYKKGKFENFDAFDFFAPD